MPGGSGRGPWLVRARSPHLVSQAMRDRMNNRNTFLLYFIFAALLLPLATLSLEAQGRGGRGGGGGGGGRGQAPPSGPIRRMPDGKPDLSGFYSAESGGANYGLEQHDRDFLTPATRGVVVDPPDRKLPYQEWARRERIVP